MSRSIVRYTGPGPRRLHGAVDRTSSCGVALRSQRRPERKRKVYRLSPIENGSTEHRTRTSRIAFWPPRVHVSQSLYTMYTCGSARFFFEQLTARQYVHKRYAYCPFLFYIYVYGVAYIFVLMITIRLSGYQR